MNFRRILFIVVLVCFSTSAIADQALVKLIAANPADGFNFPYFLASPGEPLAGQVLLLVESNNTGLRESLDDHVEPTRTYAEGRGVGPSLSRDLNLPLLVPVFPRAEQDWEIYTHALDRDTLKINAGQLKRLDLQLIAMVEDAKRRLAARGFDVADRFLICGFSASGTFSNRFAALHPNAVIGVISGGVNGIPILPVSELSGEKLIYPVGVGDLQDLTGESFKKSEWAKVPQLIFMGAQDTNDATLFEDGYSAAEQRLIHELLGKQMIPDRWLTAQSIYLKAEANVTFITYGDVGHGTNLRVRQNLANFTNALLRSLNE